MNRPGLVTLEFPQAEKGGQVHLLRSSTSPFHASFVDQQAFDKAEKISEPDPILFGPWFVIGGDRLADRTADDRVRACCGAEVGVLDSACAA